MLKKNKWNLIAASLILLLPMLVGVILWEQLPERVPVHWNMANEVDRWSGKGELVFGMPLILIAILWVGMAVTAADPKNAKASEKTVALVIWLVPVIGIAGSCATYLWALDYKISFTLIVPLLLGSIFAVIGNYMPKCRQSYTIGIKLPWTLADEENWNRTHRFAGKVWMGGGILLMLCVFLGQTVMLCVLLVMALAPVIYSWRYYRKHRKE